MKRWFFLLMTGLVVGCVPRARYERDLSICRADGVALDERYAASVRENDRLKSELSKVKDENRRFNKIYAGVVEATKEARIEK